MTDISSTSELSWRAPLWIALALTGVYVVNALYAKAVGDLGVTAIRIGGFQGLGSVDQLLLLLVMSMFFGAAVLLHPDERAES